MGFTDDVASGRQDHLLISSSPGRVFEDPFARAEAQALAAAVHEGRLDPSAMFEAILSGPGSNHAISTPGGSQHHALAAEDAGWIMSGEEGGAAAAFVPSSGREQMTRYLYWLMGHDPIASNVINVYTSLTIGEGFKIAWKSDSKAKRWKQKARQVGWARYLRKLIKHTYGLGEWFTTLLPIRGSLDASEGNLQVTMRDGGGSGPRQALRGLSPEEVLDVIYRGHPDYDPTNTNDPDAGEVLGYVRNDERRTKVAASDMIHHTFDDIGNLTRGTSVLYPVLKWLRRYDKHAENRYWLNHVRARVPLVRKVTGGQAHVAGEANRHQKLPAPGTMVTENMATSYEFPDLNIKAEDAQHDQRQNIESIAAGVHLPVYLVISNPSDSAFAALIAQDAGVQSMFEGLQEDVWVPYITQLVSELTGEGEDQFDVIPGEIVKRNMKQLADAYGTMLDRGVMSKRTARERLDLDPEVEAERVKKERETEDAHAASMVKAMGGVALPDKGGRPQGENPGDDGNGNRRPRPSGRSGE